MRWSRWKASIILFILGLVTELALAASSQYNQNFKISPKPCTVSGVDGTCMFVWECIKSDGLHLGMCMDGFMFGSCCGHNLTANFILPPSTPFRPKFKPTPPIKAKPSKVPNKPNQHGTLTIQRPNGSGTLVIRQPLKPQRPIKTKTTTRQPTTTKNPLDNFNDSSNELSASASVSASKALKFHFPLGAFSKSFSFLQARGRRHRGKSQPNQISSRSHDRRLGTRQPPPDRSQSPRRNPSRT